MQHMPGYQSYQQFSHSMGSREMDPNAGGQPYVQQPPAQDQYGYAPQGTSSFPTPSGGGGYDGGYNPGYGQPQHHPPPHHQPPHHQQGHHQPPHHQQGGCASSSAGV